MTPMEILQKIVEAESNARSIYDNAVSLREGFDSYVEERVIKLRDDCYKRAEEEIAEAKIAEKERADREIEELDRETELELSSAKQLYENQREVVVEKIFKLAVDVDA